MYIEQLYTACLAEAAYYIESDGEAAIIDPMRETQPYLELAQKRGAKIKYVLETHFHADFVSGHIDLAKKTGATIVYGPKANPKYEVHVAGDGEELKIGKLTLKVLHTPGHTPESTCYLLLDEAGKEHAIFTGDTLFVGDVGRPDLAIKGDLTEKDLAGLLYESLNSKIKPLADEVIVYPGHGAGSSCGKNIGKETFSTIGAQKQNNYALKAQSKEEFIKEVTHNLTPPPAYFFVDAAINKNGYSNLEDVMMRNLKALSADEAEQRQKQGALVLDVRTANDFEKGFIPGAINIGLDGQFAQWAGTLLNVKQPLVLVTPQGKEEETVLRLARVGYENIAGYLQGGFNSWQAAGKPAETVSSVQPTEVKQLREADNTVILDVRKPGEVENQHIAGIQYLTLAELPQRINELDKSTNYVIHCGGGYRSMIAASMLKAKGYHKVQNVYFGWSKLKDLDLPFVTGKLPEPVAV